MNTTMNTTLYILSAVMLLFICIFAYLNYIHTKESTNKTKYDATPFMGWLGRFYEAYKADLVLVNKDENLYKLTVIDISEVTIYLYLIKKGDTPSKYYFKSRKDLYKANLIRKTSPNR